MTNIFVTESSEFSENILGKLKWYSNGDTIAWNVTVPEHEILHEV